MVVTLLGFFAFFASLLMLGFFAVMLRSVPLVLRFGTMSTGGAGGLTVFSEWGFAVVFLTAVAAALLVLAVAFDAVAVECADGRFLAVLMDRPSNKI